MSSLPDGPAPHERASKRMRGAASTAGPFPSAKLLGYQFRNSYLLSEAFLQRSEPMVVDGVYYPNGNRRLAALGTSVLRTMMSQVWYETQETKQQFHLWFQLISKNSFLSKIALVNGFDAVVVGLGGDLAERDGLPLALTDTSKSKKPFSGVERERAVREERRRFERQMGDVVTALIGAVFNDCEGDVNTVLSVIWNIGLKKPKLPQDGVGIGVDVGHTERDLERKVQEIEVERQRVAEERAAEEEAIEKRDAEERAAEERAAEERAAEERAAEERAAEERAAKARAAAKRAAEARLAEAQAALERMAQEDAAHAAEQMRRARAQQQARAHDLDDEVQFVGRKKVLKRKLSQIDEPNPPPPYRGPPPPVPQRSRGPPRPTMRF